MRQGRSAQRRYLSGVAKRLRARFRCSVYRPSLSQGIGRKTIQLLDTQAWLNDGALIYVEIESELTQLAIPSSWHALKEKNAGQVSYRLYQYHADNTAEPIEDESHALAD